MLIAALIECFIICNSGEILVSAAQKCSQALYLSSWYNLKRIDQRKTVLFILRGSQDFAGFTAGGFVVSMELYQSVSQKRHHVLS